MGTLVVLLLSYLASAAGDDDQTTKGPWGWIKPDYEMNSVMDMVVAFGANYGNAAADWLGQGSGSGASGSVTNLARFNLRLKNCKSVRGAMTRYFPLTIGPGTTNSAISGYAKVERKGVDPIGETGVDQSCVYEVNELNKDEKGDQKRTSASGTKWLQLGIVQYRSNDKENLLKVNFAKSSVWDKGAKQDTYMAVPAVPAPGRKSYVQRSCHEEAGGDVCVEAVIGSGPNPRFRFEILPKKEKDLTANACVNKYRGTVSEEDTTIGRVVVPKGICHNSNFCDYMNAYFKVKKTDCTAA